MANDPMQQIFDRLRRRFMVVLAGILVLPSVLFLGQLAVAATLPGSTEAHVALGVVWRTLCVCALLVVLVNGQFRRGFQQVSRAWQADGRLIGADFAWIRGVWLRFVLAFLGLQSLAFLALTRDVAPDPAAWSALSPEHLSFALAGAFVLLLYVSVPVFLTFELMLGRHLGDFLARGWLTTARVRGLLTGPVVALIVGGNLIGTMLNTDGSGGPELAYAVVTLLAYCIAVAVMEDRLRSAAVTPLHELVRDGRAAQARGVPAVDDVAAIGRELVRERTRGLQTERELRHRERRFREIAEVASDWFFELDANLRLAWISGNVRRLARVDSEPLVGTAIGELMRPFSSEGKDRYLAALRAHESFAEIVLVHKLEDGKARHVSTSARARFDEDGTFIGYVGTARDVTDAVEAQRSLRDRSEELARVQRVQAVGELTSGVAHDFNNLLTAVSGNLELARLEAGDDEPDAEELDRLLCEAQEAARRGGALVGRLLDLVRRDVREPESIDVGALVEHLAPLLRSALGGRCTLELALDEDVVCQADAVQLENVLLNLVINARDAMDGAGRVRLTARQDDEAGCAEIEVRDTGPGVPAELRDRIFEPFFTTKGRESGTGLGLSTVRSFTAQYGGSVELDDAPDGGARFRLRLPMQPVLDPEDASGGAETTARGEAGGAGSGRSVLLVEDQTPIRNLLSKQLERLGFAVAAFADPDDALSALADGVRADMLLTDVVLGARIDGIELAEAVGECRPSLPVVFMTGYTERRGEIGDARCLDKPFGYEELARAVDEVFVEAA